MDYIVLEQVPPYDGRYEWDLEGRELTTREWGWIKRLAGYLPLNIEDGLGDPELIAVFAAIALRRAGKVEANEVPQAFERLSDAPFDGPGSRLETDTVEEGDADSPPPSSSSSNGATSGPGSPTSSEPSTATPAASGTPGSATSTSARLTSAT